MIQLTPRGATIAATEAELDTLAAEFASRHCIRLRNLLTTELLSRVVAGIQAAEFVERIHIHSKIDPPPIDRRMVDNTTSALLQFLANDPAFIRLLTRITGEGPLGKFKGTLYTLAPDTGDRDAWHDDYNGRRRLALSVNLGSERYVGGLLQLRDARSQSLLYEAANTGLGDAIIFRISKDLEHRVSPLEGTVARTAYAGWYSTGDTYHEHLRDLHENRDG